MLSLKQTIKDFLLIVSILVLLTACSGEYWHDTKSTSSGKHSKYWPGWGGGCPTYNPQYIKASNYNKYADWRPNR